MICLIFGDTDLPNKILRNIVKQKVKYFIIDLSKKNIFNKWKKFLQWYQLEWAAKD